MRNCPDFLYKETQHQGWMFRVLSECAFTVSKSFLRKKSDFLFCLCLGNSCCHVHPPVSVSNWIVFSHLLGTSLWRVSQNYKHVQMQTYCTAVHPAVRVSDRYVFMFECKKSYLKWNLSRAACGKHCHFSETAKPYKAFPPKGST